jgi:predicted N-formylglutamate amidohydrolase
MSREVAESVNALVAARLPANDRSAMTPPPFESLRPAQAAKGLIFLCDHAANALPEAYGTLGLESASLSTHIAYDIGAGEVTRTLAGLFEAPALLARWSRLLIDLNRGQDDPTLVMKLSDGSVIPGNRNADPAEIGRRIAAYHAPYHRAIEEEIARTAADVPILVSIHSFTPVWKGRKRPWEVSVLWDRDGRLAIPLMEKLAAAGLAVGDNEPYSGELENDCLSRHGTQNGLPHALIEIRQDLIADGGAAGDFAKRLYPILVEALAAMGPVSVQFTRPLAIGDYAVDEPTRIELEAAVFRRLVAHLRARAEVQNIDLMIAGGFCRNCLGDWYREAAAEKGIALEKDEARAIVYGMAPSEWKTRYQKEATPEQQAALAASQKTHS